MAEVTTPCPPSSTALLDGDQSRQLHRALDWALDTHLFAHLTPHRNTSWTFPHLILLILLWVWSERHTLTGAFQHARQLGQALLGKIILKSYPGFIDAVTTWTSTLMPLLWACLQKRMEAVGGAYWRMGSWLPLAVDGSRTTTPRTKKNEAALCPRRLGQGSTAKSRRKWKDKRRRQKKLTPVHPQIWMTLLWHMGLKMPWAWQEGPSNSSEREHLMQLLETQKFPEKTLFCGDAGFVGYDLWQAMAQRGHHFLMRVGSNIRLLRNLGDTRVHGDLVHLWPRAVAAKNQPPMALRLLKFQIGRRVMYAVTNVLAERDMTAVQAKKLYQARWGVEVQFRSLKQTFGRGKLHSRTPNRAYGELAWSLLGLWLIQLLTASEQIPAGVGPERSSVSVAIQVVRDAMAPGRPSGLKPALRGAVKDTYQRGSKKARYRPKTKDKPSAGKPKVVMASADESRKYRRLLGVK
jgi:hypothetical protein